MTVGQETMEYLEQSLAEICQKIYEQGTRRFQPLYPWIMIRVLPKEALSAGKIWMPEKRDETMYEGIVLETYRSLWKQTRKGMNFEVVCPVKVGDRVAFHYAEGLPVPDWDDRYYRIVRVEVDQEKYPRLGVMGVVHYDGDAELKNRLAGLLADVRRV